MYISASRILTGTTETVTNANQNSLFDLQVLSDIRIVAPVNTSVDPLHVTLDATNPTITVANGGGFVTPTASQTAIAYSDAQTGNAGAVAYAGQTSTLLRTNTASKKVYMTHCSIAADFAPLYVSLLDGATIVWSGLLTGEVTTTESSIDLVFPTPLVFSTSVRFEQWAAVAKNCTVSWSGWEQ